MEPEEQPVDLASQLNSALSPDVEAPVAVVPSVEPASGHPAWQSILDAVPEVLHDKIRPTLEAWDKGVEERFQKVHSQYDPYKSFVEQGVNTDQLGAGLQILQALEKDPAQFIQYAQEFYKLTPTAVSGQGQSGQQQQSEEFDLGNYDADIAEHPAVKQLREQQEQMMAQFAAQQEAQQAKEAETWIQGRQAQITEKLGQAQITPDWDYILNRALVESQRTGNYDKALDNATESFVALVNNYRAPVANLSAPPVMTANGAVPQTGPANAAQLGTDDRKKYLAQMLSAAFKE